MKEYIEREALMAQLEERRKFLFEENGDYDHYTSGFDEAVDRVEDFPAADVVEVVRCENCKCRTEETYQDGNYLCKRKMIGIVRPTDFCSYGERRAE